MEIQTKIERIRNKISELNNELREIQNSCPHPDNRLRRLARSNTGNWCEADDSYWYEFKCEDCVKIWTEDQNSTNYNRGYEVEKL